MSVRPHGTTRFQLDIFPRNLIFEFFFSEIYRYRHTRQDRWIQTELAFTLAKNATNPDSVEIVSLQTTRKENNWKTEETLVRTVVTLETERIKLVQSSMYMMMMMMILKKQSENSWSGFIWHRTWTSNGFLWMRNEPSFRLLCAAFVNPYPANVDNMASSYQCQQMADGF